LRDNPKPQWLVSVNRFELKEKQDQGILFKGPLFDKTHAANEFKTENIPGPPHPETTTPPKIGRNYKEILLNQISFWKRQPNSGMPLVNPSREMNASPPPGTGSGDKKRRKANEARKSLREKTLDRMTQKHEGNLPG